MPRYLIRLVLVFILSAAAIVSIRNLLVPESFGRLGHYRQAALAEVASQTPLYAGRATCATCHSDVVAMKTKGPHAGLSCEVCHGASGAHAQSPQSVRPFLDLDRAFCLRCHDYSPSRPAGFPMVDGLTHNKTEDCRKCHAPHNPSLAR